MWFVIVQNVCQTYKGFFLGGGGVRSGEEGQGINIWPRLNVDRFHDLFGYTDPMCNCCGYFFFSSPPLILAVINARFFSFTSNGRKEQLLNLLLCKRWERGLLFSWQSFLASPIHWFHKRLLGAFPKCQGKYGRKYEGLTDLGVVDGKPGLVENNGRGWEHVFGKAMKM